VQGGGEKMLKVQQKECGERRECGQEVMDVNVPQKSTKLIKECVRCELREGKSTQTGVKRARRSFNYKPKGVKQRTTKRRLKGGQKKSGNGTRQKTKQREGGKREEDGSVTAGGKREPGATKGEEGLTAVIENN